MTSSLEVALLPVVILYEFLLNFFLHVSHNPALSLCLLAACAWLFSFPFRIFAERLRQNEQTISRLIYPKIVEIKKTSTGRERHKRIAEVYRKFSYHPIYAVRSSLGLVLQLPFLLAGYFAILRGDGFNGTSFLGIEDLGSPDKLLGGMNLLPLLMTVFSICAVFLTTNFSFADKFKGLCVSLLFLGLLYPAPAAVVLFWTANSFFVLLAATGKRHIGLICSTLNMRLQ